MVLRKSDENEKEYAYRELRNSIMSLELKPGEAVSETERKIIYDDFGS